MAVGGHRHTPAALPPRKADYPLCRRLGGQFWMVAENLAPTGIRLPDSPARNVVAIDLIKVLMGARNI